MLVGGDHHAFDAGLSNSACRIVDDTQQGLFILGVDDDAEVGQQVFDFLAVVEREAAIYLIRYVLLAQGFFHRAALGVGAVEDGEVLVGEVACHLVSENAVGH